MTIQEICHVCGCEKKPYLVIMENDFVSFIQYNEARREGAICERCDHYYAMTGEFKNATDEEFKIAELSCWFAHRMLEWWEKDKKNGIIDDKDNPLFVDIKATEKENMRVWEGTYDIAKWMRGHLAKQKSLIKIYHGVRE